jgi:OOP family OmpA-OmpF porin
MKKWLFALVLMLSAVNAGAVPDYYAGLDLGYSNTHYSDAVLGSDSSTAGFGTRLYGGYEFTPNYAVELGWTRFAKASGNRTKSVSQYAYDASFVGRYPITNSGLSIFAKLGLAYVQAKKDFSGQGHAYANNIRPAYGIGVENVFTPHLSMLVQLWHVQGKNDAFSGFNVNGKLPDADLYTVGVIYRFI